MMCFAVVSHMGWRYETCVAVFFLNNSFYSQNLYSHKGNALWMQNYGFFQIYFNIYKKNHQITLGCKRHSLKDIFLRKSYC